MATTTGVLVVFAPVLLGGGTRMFGSTGGSRVNVACTTDDTAHWYRVRR